MTPNLKTKIETTKRLERPRLNPANTYAQRYGLYCLAKNINSFKNNMNDEFMFYMNLSIKRNIKLLSGDDKKELKQMITNNFFEI